MSLWINKINKIFNDQLEFDDIFILIFGKYSGSVQSFFLKIYKNLENRAIIH